MNKRLLSYFAMAAVLLCLMAGATQAADDLVAFDRSRIAEIGKSFDLSVIAKLDDTAVALIRHGDFEELQKIDDSVRLIESPTDINQLWVTGNDGSQLPGLLLETEKNLLLKLSYDEARTLMASGVRLSKCHRVDLPADPPFFVPAKLPPRSSLTTDIDSLMALVSVDSIIAYLQRLQDFQTRYTCTDSFWMAGEWVSAKFASWGYDSLTFQEFPTWMGCNSRNVIATKIGDVYPDRFIIVGGHYDAVVYDGGDPNVWAPGADDNGTGSAMAMEIARVLADTPFKKSVRFMTFGAEEQGLIGSWYYVADALEREEAIELMVNADMIGNVADSYLDFSIRCNEGGVPYGEVLEEIAEEYTPLIPELSVGEFSGSDHYPFDQSGFRTIYSAEGDFSPHWHEGTDIIDNIDPVYVADIVRSNLGALLIAIEAPSPITGLQALNVGDGHTVYLQWDESPDFDVIGYEVYVGTTEDGASIYDTSYAAVDTVYNLEEDTPYYFGIAGFTADGARSLIDEFVQLTPRSIPTRADTLIVIPDFGQLLIQWTAIPDLDFEYYQLYKRIGDSGEYEPYQQLPDDDEFIDEDVQPNIPYYYYVTLVDTTGLESEPSHADYALVLSFDSGILLVDETRDYAGGQGTPTDEEQDAFYQYISEGYQVTFHDYLDDGAPRINDLGPYSTLVWMDDDVSSQYLTSVDQTLAQYLDVGGNLLFFGWRSFAGYSNQRPYDFEPGTFPHDYLGIDRINSTNSPDFEGAVGAENWPDMAVLPERVMPSWEGRLIAIDVMDLQNESTAIYSFISSSGDTLFDGKPVGIFAEYANSGIIYLTFPLYPAGDEIGREIFRAAMDHLGEQSTGIEDFAGSKDVPSMLLSQNYPNPFNAETKIRFRLAQSSRVRLAIFNILGQEVAVLADGVYPAGVRLIAWDGGNLPSGIYFYRLTLPEGSISRRMILLR